MPKKILNTDITGQRGINLIESVLLEIGFLWHPTKLEAGIDGYIEIRDSVTGIVTNRIIQVQSRATEQPFTNETPESFDFYCNENELTYWLDGNAPVILVRSRPATREAYWVSIKDYFADKSRRASHKVVFNKKTDKFDATCRNKFFNLAIPEATGIYLAPLPKHELLASNLLTVEFPEHIYRAQTDFRNDGAVFTRLRDYVDDPDGDWALYQDAIVSFHDLATYPWSNVIRPGSCRRSDTRGWMMSPDAATQSVFLDLLYNCFRHKADMLDLRWSRNKECWFVRPTTNLSERCFSNRSIFGAYAYKKRPDSIAYYRHSALQAHFCCFDEQWFLEITPTYYYTRDGYKLDRFYEARLSGIKRLERNNAVAGQVTMWAEFLRQYQTADLLSQPYAFLKFGELQGFEVDFGISDELWKPPKTSETTSKRLFE